KEVFLNADILRKSLIFSNLSENDLLLLAKLVVEYRFEAGAFVFMEGASPDWFYAVAEGNIKVFKISSSGKELIVAVFGPGDIFGEVAVFENKPYPASAQAMTGVKVLGIKNQDFVKFIVEHPQLALKWVLKIRIL
ncbi:MAG: cyclic nucleotide-binding domain-containing protein, partial [Chloroflexi bacterium]|nr:cyclic nucleotide-binding domain-containing protein [Chloroflexota bacterium]